MPILNMVKVTLKPHRRLMCNLNTLVSFDFWKFYFTLRSYLFVYKIQYICSLNELYVNCKFQERNLITEKNFIKCSNK